MVPFSRVHKRIFIAATLAAMISACAQPEDSAKPAVPKEPVEANVSIDKAVATTGDILTYSIHVDYEEGIELEIPEVGSQISGFRITDFGKDEPQKANGRVEQRAWYQLRGDLVGSYILPSLTIAFEHQGEKKTISTSELFVEIESVLPSDGSATDIRGLKPLKRVELDPKWPLYAGITAAIVAILLLGLWGWRRRTKMAVNVPIIPPHDMAFEALAQLRSTDFSNPEAVRRYFFAISSILRTYIEDRFEINATDLTTEELLPRLQAHPAIGSTSKSELRQFLLTTDSVKFANHQPSKSEIETAYETALSFVEKTVPQAPNDSNQIPLESAA